jgi:hypothetical protein
MNNLQENAETRFVRITNFEPTFPKLIMSYKKLISYRKQALQWAMATVAA